MASDTTTMMIKLKSSDRRLFVVPGTVARQSQVINRLIDGMSSEVEGIYMELTVVPVPLVPAQVLKKVITYCEKHAEAADATKTEKAGKGSCTTPASDGELRNWDKQFIDAHQAMLNDLLMAANFLEIDGLLDLTCQKLSDMTRCKSYDEISEMLDIGDDFTAVRFAEKRMLTLTSSDGQEFAVTQAVAKESQMLLGMIEEDCMITNILLPNADSKVLKKVLQYCQKHTEEKEKAASVSEPQTANGEGSSSSARTTPKTSNEHLNGWDKEFMKDADIDMLYDLLMACHNLKVEGLLHLTAETVADIIKGNSAEQIREIFNMRSDFTPEEEEQIRNEHPWAFFE